MNSLRVLLPVVLFIAFAGANYMASQQHVESLDLAAADQDLKAGTQLTEARLTKVTVQGPIELFRTFVPFGNRGKDLLYLPINRDIKQGEIISLSDLVLPTENSVQLEPDEVGVHVSLERLQFAEGQLSVGIEVGFLLEKSEASPLADLGREKKWTIDPVPLGPFRIVGIGNEVFASRQTQDDSRSNNAKLVTIAAKLINEKSLEDKAARLVAAAADEVTDRSERVRALVILAKKPSIKSPKTAQTSSTVRPAQPLAEK